MRCCEQPRPKQGFLLQLVPCDSVMKISTPERGRERIAVMGARPIAHIVRIARRWRRKQRHTRQTVGQRTTDGLVARLVLRLMRRPCAARETRPPGNPRRSAVPAPDGAAAVAD